MGCVYILKGHTFNSELELDDYLLEKHKYFSSLGDIVFSKSSKALYTIDLLKKLKQETKDLKFSRDLPQQGRLDLDGVTATDKNHVGVNDFLSGLKNLQGGLLFPEFLIENYWKETRPRWAGGKFEQDEIDTIFGPNGTPKPIITEEEFKIATEAMEARWKNQALIGTEIHKFPKEYFNTINKGIRNIDYSKLIDTNLVPIKVLKDLENYCQNLEKTLRETLGDDLTFFPEFEISGMTQQLDENGNPKNIIGIIDLLVVDKNGHIHIIDYKTSPKDYSNYGDPKILTFKYQLGVYERLLKKYGINTSYTKLFVAPIQLLDFKPDGDKWTYDGINEQFGYITDLTEDIKNNVNIQTNIDEFLPAPFIKKASTDQLLQKVTSAMSQMFKDYSSTPQAITDESVWEFIKRNKADIQDPETGKYNLKKWNLSTNSKEELFSIVKRRLISIANNKIDLTQTIKRGLEEAIKEENPYYDFITEGIPVDEKGITGWFRSSMSKYCNKHWEVIDCEPAEYLGCILVRNKETNIIELIKISTADIDSYINTVKGRSVITGTFEDDQTAERKPEQQILKCTRGNVELIEAMLVLNNIPELFKENAIIGEVHVYNPVKGQGISAPNKQLLYSFNELASFINLEENNFKDYTIKLASNVDLFYRKIKEALEQANTDKNIKRIFSKVSGCTSIIDSESDNLIEMRAKLLKLQKEFMKMYPEVGKLTKYDPLAQPQVELFRLLSEAIGELSGITYLQLVKERKGSISSFINNYRINNPGNLNNPTLDNLTALVNVAYQNVRDTNMRYLLELRNLVNKLKKDSSFSYMKERTSGNQANLYKDMIIFEDDDIILQNPDSPTNGLSPVQREFLKYFLNVVNHNRYRDRTEEEIEEWRLSNDPRYYRLPLSYGGFSSIASNKGLINAFKEKFKTLAPSKAKETIMTTMEGYLNPDDSKYKSASEAELWEMTNAFDAGEDPEYRKIIIERFKEEGKAFEYNLETLLLRHITSYAAKENLDLIFPAIQAIAIHITNSGMEQNTEFTKEIDYLKQYIKNKIFNLSLIKEEYQKYYVIAQEVMSKASQLALAFNPRQYYQILDGIWKDVSLVIRKPDGDTSFTKENMMSAFKTVAEDMLHYGNDITKCEQINFLYGINDVDMNVIADKLKSDQTGIWNFWSMAFRPASKPDYYNRLSIFVAQMKGDGCWEAHEMKDGKLVYNWKKDKRFEAFANNRTTHPDYKKQKALYYDLANQFIKEHTRNPDGTLFKMGDALPRAYTAQQSESNKALSDSIYGYYSHEKKSLIQSTFVGSLLFQMNTFFSSKKKQFLDPGGIKAQGKYVPWKVNGKQQYHRVDENGEIIEGYTEEDTGLPCYVWEGRWEEGIFITCWNIIKGAYANGIKEGNFRNGWDYVVNDIWNNKDPELQRLYRSNLKQLLYDLLMFLIVGSLGLGIITELAKANIKERGNDTLADSALNTGIQLSTDILKASTEDFNFFKSIFGKSLSWTPFSIQTLTRTVNTFSNVISGNTDFYDGIINTIGATRATKPFWEYVTTNQE